MASEKLAEELVEMFKFELNLKVNNFVFVSSIFIFVILHWKLYKLGFRF